MSAFALWALQLAFVPPEFLTVTASTDARSIEASLTLSPKVAASLPTGRIDSRTGRRLLKLVVLDEDGAHGPPLFARYRREDGRLFLVPRHPLLPGMTYVVVATQPTGERVERAHRVPASPKELPARVTAVYPSADVLPANCLKFYVHFSRPMREGRDVFDRVKIVDDFGRPLPHPWRRTELWDDEARRLTLWIHPGRVKRGVNLREDFGPVLHPGRKYRLVVSREVRAEDGTMLAARFEKTFRTSDEDRTRPRPTSWRLRPPRIGTREPLHVALDEPCDRALLSRMVGLRTGRTVVAASVIVGTGERSFQVVPDRPWREGNYALYVDGDLEDLAGNTPRRVFDKDLEDQQTDEPRLVLPFRTRSSRRKGGDVECGPQANVGRLRRRGRTDPGFRNARSPGTGTPSRLTRGWCGHGLTED